MYAVASAVSLNSLGIAWAVDALRDCYEVRLQLGRDSVDREVELIAFELVRIRGQAFVL